MDIKKKILSVLLLMTLAFTSFVFVGNAETKSDFSVSLSFPEIVEPGDRIEVVITVNDITYVPFEYGKGILGASIYLYYDCDALIPVKDSFSAVTPSGWDSFDGSSQKGVWAMHCVFDGVLSNGAVDDGALSFTVSFDVDKKAQPSEIYFTIDNCEGAEYSNKSLAYFQSFDSSAYCKEKLTIIEPRILILKDESTFDIDRDGFAIYSDLSPLDYDSFSSLFSIIGGDMKIKAFDYEVTSENGKYIPNGAEISVCHTKSDRTFTYKYFLLGDCDNNGEVNVSDLATIKYTIVNRIPAEGHTLFAMDLEKDGVVRIADYLRLKMQIAKDKK